MVKRLCLGRMVLVCGSVAILLLGIPTIVASAGEVPRLLVDYEAVKKSHIIPGTSKVSSSIQAVIAKANARGISRENVKALGVSILSSPVLKVSEEGNIQTYIQVDGFRAEDRAVLESYGVIIEIVNEELRMIQAWIPFDSTYEVAQLPFVRRVTQPTYGVPRVGSVTSQGDAILKADALRSFGYNGSGARIGVIADGVDNRAAAQATGDLPPRVDIVTFAGSGDEGTAMLEIVHDLAPGAELGFCGGQTSLEFIQCVNDLAGAFGANIIVDDLGFLLEPYFEDGPVAQAVRNVLTRAVYVSAAGNDAQHHYEGGFVGLAIGDLNVHDFGKAAGGQSDPTMNVLVPSSGTIDVYLQWNDRFGMSANDYDLLLLNEAEDTVLAASTDIQKGNGDPREVVEFTNFGADPVRMKILVVKYAGSDKLLDMFIEGATVEEYDVPGGSIVGHPAVPGVLAVAAIGADDPGNKDIEPYSSRGPCQIFFPSQETRQKPDITAIDGVSVSGAGGFRSPFFGTSAAAPHVAGVAALLKGVNPTATPANIATALTKGAVDLGSPGADSTFGAGLVNALNAAAAISGELQVGGETGTTTESVSLFTALTLELNVTDHGVNPPAGVKQEWLVFGAIVGGKQTDYFFFDKGGEVTALSQVIDPATVTFTFNHTAPVQTLTTNLVLASFGLKRGDSFFYLYVWSATPVTTFSNAPDLKFDNVVVLTVQ